MPILTSSPGRERTTLIPSRRLADDGLLDERLVDGEGEVEGREDRRGREAGDGGGDDLDPDILAGGAAQHEIEEEGEDHADDAAERPVAEPGEALVDQQRCG